MLERALPSQDFSDHPPGRSAAVQPVSDVSAAQQRKPRTACVYSTAVTHQGAQGPQARTCSARRVPAPPVLRVPCFATPQLRPCRTIYFFVSRTVLPTRVCRNSRVTATVTLFIILLDTTCAQPRQLRTAGRSRSHTPCQSPSAACRLRCAAARSRGLRRATEVQMSCATVSQRGASLAEGAAQSSTDGASPPNR